MKGGVEPQKKRDGKDLMVQLHIEYDCVMTKPYADSYLLFNCQELMPM